MSIGGGRILDLRELGCEESAFIICYGIQKIQFQKKWEFLLIELFIGCQVFVYKEGLYYCIIQWGIRPSLASTKEG